MEEFDFFVSHASANKSQFVRPLADALTRAGYRVWYDELSIKPGESIRRSIDSGISKSRAGIVVLSQAFFARPWPQAELDALLSLHIGQKKHIIPIWFEIDPDEVAAISPLIADRKAIKAPAPLAEIVQSIVETLPIAPVDDNEIEQVLSTHRDERFVTQQRLIHECSSRICAIAQLASEYWTTLVSDNDSKDDDAFEERMTQWWSAISERLRIPNAVYFGEPQPISDKELRWVLRALKAWIRGELDWKEAAALYFWLDESIDADYLYVLFGIPIKRVRFEQRDRLHQAIIDVGMRHCATGKTIDFQKAFDHTFHNWYDSLRKQRPVVG